MTFAAQPAFQWTSTRFRVDTPAPSPAPEPEAPPKPERPARLTDRLDGEITRIEEAGYHVRWLEMGRDEMLALFREGGDEAIRLDPDPVKDCGWYRAYEVRYTGRALIWIMIEGEVPGEISAHVID